MALGQTAGCPRVNRARKLNTGNKNFSLWLTGGLSQGCPDFQKVYVFKVYVYDIVDHLHGSFGPLGSRGLSAPGAQKVRKKSKTEFKTLKKTWNIANLDYFLTFWGPGADRPGNPFRDFFRT